MRAQRNSDSLAVANPDFEVVALKKVLAVLLGLLFLGSNSGQAQPPARRHSNRGTRITVRIQNYAGVPLRPLARAEEIASDILNQAGVEVRWLHCGPAAGTPQPSPDCAKPLGSMDFVVALIGKIQTLSPELPEGTLGIALVPPDGRQGFQAYVSYDRARGTARDTQVSVDRVLGSGAAHELGHLLLGEGAHSSTGIMRIVWGKADLKSGLNWNWWFTPQQSKLIRANLELRLATLRETPSTPGEISSGPRLSPSLSTSLPTL